MGRKAKLKKQRRQAQQNKNPSEIEQSNPQDFIGQMVKEGYHLETIERSPEVPKERIEPQI